MSQEQNTLELIRNAATQYGRCCDLYQDGLGTFHCHEDGQRTFAMLRDVQQILGVDKALGNLPDEDRIAARERANLNAAAPDLLSEMQGLIDWLDDNQRSIEGMFSMDELLSGPRAAVAKATGAA